MLGDIKSTLEKSYKPAYMSISDKDGILRLVMVSKVFNNMHNIHDRNEMVSATVRDLYDSVSLPITFFLMTEDEYFQTINSPTFAGI